MKTVWEFRSIDGKEVVRKMLPSYPDDFQYQHEYQRIVFRGDAVEAQGLNDADAVGRLAPCKRDRK